jgi:hypothetical protein
MPVGSGDLLGHTANSNGVSIQTKPRICRLTRQEPSQLSGLVCYSPSIQKYFYRMTSEESQASLESALARPRQPDSIWQILRAKYWQSDICRGSHLYLRRQILRLAVRWSILEVLIPSIRRRGQEDALIDRFQVETEPSSRHQFSVCGSLVERLQSYRDEWSRIVVWPNEKS